MIDQITSNFEDARQGFVRLFSGHPFPNHQHRLKWRRQEGAGNVYYSPDLDAEDGFVRHVYVIWTKLRPKFLFR
jgi:hypothetical protein